MAPNRRPRTVAEGIADAVNKYGLPEGQQLGEAASSGGPPPPRPMSNRARASSYSAEIKLPTLASPIVNGPAVPAEDDCSLWTINIKPLNCDPSTILTLYVDYDALGGINYVKQFAIRPSQTLISIPIQGRQIGVSMKASQTTEADYVVTVDIAIEKGIYTNSTERFCPVWAKDSKVAAAYADYQNVISGSNARPGLFFAATGTVLSMGGAAVLFPLIVDVAAVGRPADNSVPLYTGPALTAANQNFSFGDEFRPTINFVLGLSLVLSTTPDVVTHQETATKWSNVKIGF
jgi:hypothetical protein